MQLANIEISINSFTFTRFYKAFAICSQKRREGGQGGGGGGCPSNVLQDHFPNSPNSGIKISGGGGGKADDLGNYNLYENKILQSCHLNCIFPRSVRH